MPHENLAEVYCKTPEVSSLSSILSHRSNTTLKMKVALEQFVSQMTQLSVNLLQTCSFRNAEQNSNKIQCYVWKKCTTFHEIILIKMHKEAMMHIEYFFQDGIFFADDKKVLSESDEDSRWFLSKIWLLTLNIFCVMRSMLWQTSDEKKHLNLRMRWRRWQGRRD